MPKPSPRRATRATTVTLMTEVRTVPVSVKAWEMTPVVLAIVHICMFCVFFGYSLGVDDSYLHGVSTPSFFHRGICIIRACDSDRNSATCG